MPLAQTRLETLQICKLLQCVREEERVQIEKLTLNGVPHLINYNEPTTGETALSTAAAANNDSMIEYLIGLGAYPDVNDFSGRTAAMRASELGNVQCLEALAKAGCNMTLTDNNGKGVLFYCISPTTRHDKCMQIVVAHGADVNNTSKDTSPVFLAACEIASQAEGACLSLLGKGADPNGKNEKTNRTALMAACASGSVRVVRAILEGSGDIDVVMLKCKVHAAHEAARGGFLDVLMVLATYGANFDQYDEKGNTPIHYAARGGHAMCCKYLSQRGCNPKPKNEEGLQAKAVAKENGHKEALKECKKAEKSFGKGGKNNDPWALRLYDFCTEKEEQFRAMFVKYDTIAQGTVSRGDFLEVLQNMAVPMPEEADMKNLLVVHDNKTKDGVIDYNEFLLGKKYVNKQFLRSAFEPKAKKGKKKGGKGKKGKTKVPLPICTQVEGPRASDGGPPSEFIPRHDHYTDLGRFNRDKPPEHPLQDDSGWYLHHPDRTYMRLNGAAKHRDLDSMTGVFQNNKSLVDTKDRFYKTPLMIACLQGNLEVTKFLVDNGANLQSEDNFRWTPLHFACHSGMYDVIEYLVEKGANIDAVTMNGATPFMRAIESSKPEIVQYLLEKGVKVQTETRKGHTPMDLAASWADARVFNIVKAKWDSLPAPKDKKDDKKGGKKGGGAKRPGSSSPAKAFASAAPDSPDLDMPGHHRKGSILRAASALAGGIEEVEDITFTPIKQWTEQPTSEDLIQRRVETRGRFGWEVDFADFQMPLLKNVYERVEVFGGIEVD